MPSLARFRLDAALYLTAIVLGVALFVLAVLRFDNIYSQSDLLMMHGLGQSLNSGALAPIEVYDRALLKAYVEGHYAGVMLNHGGDYWFGYPPPVLWFHQSFALLSPTMFWSVSAAIGFSMFLLTGWMWGLRGLALIAFAINPVSASAVGYFNWLAILLMGALSFGLYCLHNGRWRTAGVVLAFLALKPQWALVAAFIVLLHWNWRTALYLLLGGMVLVASSAAFYGVDTWAASYSTSVEFSQMVRETNFTAGAQLSIYGLARGLGLDDGPAMVWHGASILVAFSAFLWKRSDATAVILAITIPPYNLASAMVLVVVVIAPMMVGQERWRGLLLFAVITMPIPWPHNSAELWACLVVLLVPPLRKTLAPSHLT